MIKKINLIRLRLRHSALAILLLVCFQYTVSAQQYNDTDVVKQTEKSSESENDVVNGGTLIPLTPTNICLGNGGDTEVRFMLEGASGDSSLFLVTSESGVVQFIPKGSEIDFGQEDPGVYLVYHLSYKTIQFHPIPGWNIKKLRGWFDLSEPVYVQTGYAIAGNIYIEEPDSTKVTFCTSDGESDEFAVSGSGSRGDHKFYAITDRNNTILKIEESNVFDFEGIEEGLCYIYKLAAPSFTTIPQEGDQVTDFNGCFDISNRIEVTRTHDCTDPPECEVFAGTIMTITGTVSSTVCVDDGIADSLVVVLASGISDASTYVVTDSDRNILKTQESNVFDFEDTDLGNCMIFNLAYNDEITGLEVGNSIDDIEGCYDVTNPISVRRVSCVCDVRGGSIMTSDSLTSLTICTMDGESDEFDISVSGAAGDSSQFIITDSDGTILKIQDSAIVDLEGTESGTCMVMHLSYEGVLTGVEVGASIADIGGCFDLSNAITVHRTCAGMCLVDGGTIQFADGTDSLRICTRDGMADSLHINTSGASGDNMQLIITDSDGKILKIVQDSIVDLEGTPDGVCMIWNIAYDSTAQNIVVDSLTSDITGCFDLSNSLTVVRTCPDLCDVDGGSILFSDTTQSKQICTMDGLSDSLEIITNGAVGDSVQLIVTDSDGKILKVAQDSIIDFEGTPAGMCFIWNIAHDETLQNLVVDSLVSNLEGCFSLSNSLQVMRTCDTLCNVDAGQISLDSAVTMITLCVDDGIADSLTVNVANVVGDSSVLIITDTTSKILKIIDGNITDFEGTPEGVCQIWNLAYDGEISGLEVDSLVNDIVGECYSLSNAITVTREINCDCDADGGALVANDSLTSIDICTLDQMPDVIRFSASNVVGDSSFYLITTMDSIVISTFSRDSFDFENTGTVDVQVFNLAYRDSIPTIENGMKFNFDNTDHCFDVSNPVIINRTATCSDSLLCMATSAVLSVDGETIVSICNNDSVIDSVFIDASGVGGDTIIWAVTNDMNIITRLEEDQPIVFDETVSEDENVYLISFTDETTGIAVGSSIDSLGGCFALSNRIQIVKDPDCDVNCMVDAGMVALEDGENQISLCVDDGIRDTVRVVVTGAVGDSMQLVVTDSLNNILAVTSEGFIDFEGTPAGICFIRSIVFDATLDGLIVNEHLDSLVGCFDLSNAISVIREHDCGTMGGLSAGTLSIQNTSATTSDSIDVCVGDRVLDYVNVGVVGNRGAFQNFVLTNANDSIINSQAGTQFNVTQLPSGTCYIYHLVSEDEDFNVITGTDINRLNGDYELSNRAVLTKADGCAPCNMETFSAGGIMITGTQGVTIDTVCAVNNRVDTVRISGINQVGNHSFFMTNLRGDILEINQDGIFEMEDTTDPLRFIWAIGYAGEIINFEVGGNMNRIGGCRQYSNFIRIINDQDCEDEMVQCDVVAGQISVQNNALDTTVIVGDGIADSLTVQFTTDAQNADSLLYLITDDNDEILAISPQPTFDFEQTGEGVSRLYSAAIGGEFDGLAVGNDIALATGCIEFSNSVIVTRTGVCDVVASSITFAGGNQDTTVVVGDSLADVLTISVVTAAQNADSILTVITSSQDSILKISADLSTDFEETLPGVCRVRQLAYEGTITGLEVGAHISAITGCHVFSNALTVDRQEACDVVASSITFAGGNQDTTVVVGDSLADVLTISVVTAAQNADSVLTVITSSQDSILKISADLSTDFEETLPGVCRVRQLAYEGTITGLEVGAHISAITGCHVFSNALTVDRQEACDVVASSITFAGGNQDTTVVVGDSLADVLTISVVTAAQNADSVLTVITSSQDSILKISADLSTDFEETLPGVCRVRQLAYEGTITGLEVGAHISAITGCHVFSNALTVDRQEACTVDGGMISLANQSMDTTICINDSMSTTLTVNRMNTSGDSLLYVITDDQNKVLKIQDSNDITFENVPVGVCRIWSVAVGDNFMGLAVDSNVSDWTGCYDASNFLRVNREDCSEMIMLSTPSITFAGGTTSLNVCPTGMEAETIVPVVVDSNDVNSTFFITNSTSEIIDIPAGDTIDVTQYEEDIVFINYISYQTGLEGLVVDSLITDLNGNYALSLAIAVIKSESNCGEMTDCSQYNGGTLMTSSETMFDMICVSDTKQDVVQFALTDNDSSAALLVITNANDTVTAISESLSFDFDGLPAGSYQVYNLSYEGDSLPISVGQDKDNIPQSLCFDYSNGVSITAVSVENTQVMMTDGRDTISICTDDGSSTELTVTNNENITNNYFYVVTDSEDQFLAGMPSGTIDVADYTADTLKVYGLRIIQTPTFVTGESIFTQNISSDCFAFSGNFVWIEKASGDNCGGGLQEEDIELRVLQNPVTETIDLDIDAGDYRGPSRIAVMTNTGSVIMSQDIQLDQEKMIKKIDASHWPNGILFISLYTGNELRTIKVVKQ